MNRRKAEAQKQLDSLMEECKVTVSLLQKLMGACCNCVSDINQLDSKDFRMYSKYYLSIIQFQAASMQKVMGWNIEFEDFLSQMLPANLETFKMLVGGKGFSTSETSLASPCSLDTVSHDETGQNLGTTNKDTAMNDLRLNFKPNNNVPTVDLKNKIVNVENEALPDKQREIPEKVKIKQKTKGSQSDEQPSKATANNYCNTSFDDQIFGSDESFFSNVDDLLSLNDETVTEEALHKGPAKIELENNSQRFTSSRTTSLSQKLNTPKAPKTAEILLKQTAIDEPVCEENSEEETKTFQSEKLKEQINNIVSPRRLSATSDDYVFEPFETSISDSDNFFSLDDDQAEKPSQQPKITELNDDSRNISQRLNAYPQTSLYSIQKTNIPRAPTPDVSLKPSISIKEDIPEDACSYALTTDNLRKFSEKQKTEVENANIFLEFKSTITMDKEIPKEPVSVGDLFMIGYTESPSKIYIQVVNQNSTCLDELSVQIGNFCSNITFNCTSKNATKGLLDDICAYYDLTDRSWYRVEVTDWIMNDMDQVEVYFIDYGYKYSTSYKQLRPLKKKLQQVPRIAQLCHLAYLYPPGSSKDKKLTSWPPEIINGFYEILGDLNDVVYRIAHSWYDEERESYEIDFMKDDESDPEWTIGQILIGSGMAEEIIDAQVEVKDKVLSTPGSSAMAPCTVHDILEEYFQNDVMEEPRNISEAIMYYNAQDEARTCKNLRKNGTCYKGKSCRFLHIPLTSGYTRDKHTRYYRAFNDDNLPSIGEEVMVVISHVIDIDCFYVQICNQDNHYHTRNTTLTGLIETMNSPDMVKTYRPLRFIPAHGEIVIVKHWNDYWYRGQVKAVRIPEEGPITAEVYVVDFGDILEVPMTNLRVINPAFLHLSFQAIQCIFFNVKHKKGSNRAREKEHIEKNYLGQKFLAKVMAGVTRHLELLLFTLEQNEELGLKIIEEGHGEFKKEHILAAEDERILVD